MTHPPRAALEGYAAGEAELTRRLLVEAHLGLCPACSRIVAEYRETEPGLPEATASDENTAPSFERVWAAVEHRGITAQPILAPVLPPGLLAAVPDPAGWHWVTAGTAGVRSALLVRDAESGSALHLSYFPPQSRYPHHRHLGLEENVILSGGYQDGGVHVEAGDWVFVPRDTEHAPATGPDEECWCLSRLEPPGVEFSRRSGA